MASRWLRRVLVGAGFWALLTSGASALTLQIVGGGLSAVSSNYGCPTGSVNCGLSRDVQLTGFAPATGTIVIDALGTSATISISIAGATFDPIGAGSSVVFGATTYSATFAITSTPIGPGTGAASGSGSTAGSVSGTADSLAFAVSGTTASINCLYPDGIGTCGVAFGGAGFSGVADHRWLHTFNVDVVALPEPTTALLLALGAAGLLLRTRRS